MSSGIAGWLQRELLRPGVERYAFISFIPCSPCLGDLSGRDHIAYLVTCAPSSPMMNTLTERTILTWSESRSCLLTLAGCCERFMNRAFWPTAGTRASFHTQ